MPVRPLLVSFLLFGLIGPSALPAAFTVTGQLPANDATTVATVVRESLEARSSTPVASARVTDGAFTLAVDAPAGLFKLQLGGSTLNFVAADGDTLTLDPTGKTLTGGAAQADFLAYESFRSASLARTVYPVRAAIAKARGTRDLAEVERLTLAETEAYDTHRRELNDFTLATLGGSPALYAASLRWDGDYRLDELAALVEAYAVAHPTEEIAALMQARLVRFRATAIGAIAPDLAGPTPDGGSLALADLRGQVVLVDFWASWCPPCRIENRHYVDLYQKYRDAGFEILAVSVDQNGTAWRNAIDDDHATWKHLSDLTGWKTPLAAAYNVAALPASFLLDAEGRIIGKNLRGAALDAALAACFP